MWSLSGSWRVPSSLTTVPLTWTRPSRMISSALRRLAMPAFARILWRRSPVGSSLLPGGVAEVGLVIYSGFMIAGLLFSVWAALELNYPLHTAALTLHSSLLLYTYYILC